MILDFIFCLLAACFVFLAFGEFFYACIKHFSGRGNKKHAAIRGEEK